MCRGQLPGSSAALCSVSSGFPLLHDALAVDLDTPKGVVLPGDASDSDYDPSMCPVFERRRSLRMRKASAFRTALSLPSDDDAEKDKGRKVGRPIAYKGDPNSPALTEEERRRVKRRIANRESARRVRQKRQDHLGVLQIKVTATHVPILFDIWHRAVRQHGFDSWTGDKGKASKTFQLACFNFVGKRSTRGNTSMYHGYDALRCSRQQFSCAQGLGHSVLTVVIRRCCSKISWWLATIPFCFIIVARRPWVLVAGFCPC
eukprot:jgi/Botrbrau1/20391/Bobra.0006s0052.1